MCVCVCVCWGGGAPWALGRRAPWRPPGGPTAPSYRPAAAPLHQHRNRATSRAPPILTLAIIQAAAGTLVGAGRVARGLRSRLLLCGD